MLMHNILLFLILASWIRHERKLNRKDSEIKAMVSVLCHSLFEFDLVNV